MSIPQTATRPCPTWDRDIPLPQQFTAEDIRSIVLAAENDVVERLALASLSCIEERDSARAVLRRALSALRDQDATIDRQRDLIADLRSRIREHVRAAA